MKIPKRTLAPVPLSIVGATLLAGSLFGFRSISHQAGGSVSFFKFETVPGGFDVNESNGIVQVSATADATGGPSTDKFLDGYGRMEYHVASSSSGDKDILVLFTEVNRAFSSVKTDAQGAVAYAESTAIVNSSVGSSGNNPAKSGPSPISTRRRRAYAQNSPKGSSFYPFLLRTSTLTSYALASYKEPTNGSATNGAGPIGPMPGVPNLAKASATASSKITMSGAKLYPPRSASSATAPSPVTVTGSAVRDQTNFLVTRGDGVAEPINACDRSSDGTITFDGFGFPNTNLTIKLIQPGFLQQTQQRMVVNDVMTLASNPNVEVPLAIELVFGDANGDNQINQADISIINGYVGRTAGTPGWTQVVPNSQLMGGEIPILVRDLDENQDGQITAADVNVALANVGRTL